MFQIRTGRSCWGKSALPLQPSDRQAPSLLMMNVWMSSRKDRSLKRQTGESSESGRLTHCRERNIDDNLEEELDGTVKFGDFSNSCSCHNRVSHILHLCTGDAMDFGACGRSQNQHFHFGRDEAAARHTKPRCQSVN